jgi:hypothetical protein
MNGIIDSPNFVNWFGNWRNGKDCSQVVDENGSPLIVYHGTENEFDEFKSEYMGKTGTALGQGFYFTSNKDDAAGFGNIVKAFYLNIRKPLSLDKLTLNTKEIMKLIDVIDRTQCEKDPEFGYGILSDFGDVDYEGRDKVLRNATQMLSGEENDVELVGGLINASGDYDLVVNVLRKVLGFDGVICRERGVYVVHHSNQVKRIDNINFNNDSNNVNESKKKIYITESQLKFITQVTNKKG